MGEIAFCEYQEICGDGANHQNNQKKESRRQHPEKP